MRILTTVLLGFMIATSAQAKETQCPTSGDYSLAIHGGAGVILKENMSDERETEYRKALNFALMTGQALLDEGASALDVVEAVIVTMEDDPKFNAGVGAVFSAAGKNELDAAIMDGRDRNAGAVAGVQKVKNPIKLARVVMEKSPHVMLQTKGAEKFAKAQGLDMVKNKHFFTERRYKQMKNKMKKIKKGALLSPLEGAPQTRFGTVGAVAKDSCGNLAAATSTGGLTGKQWGRVGDAPIIGAGTYADNRVCAVSATGTGEYFIRATIARDICARRQYLKEPIKASANHMIHKTLADMGGDGGVVAIDENGQPSFAFNTAGMYRGYVTPDARSVEIFALTEKEKALP